MEKIMSGMFLLNTYPLLRVFSFCSTPARTTSKTDFCLWLGEADFIFISLQDKKSVSMIYLLKRRNDFTELLLLAN